MPLAADELRHGLLYLLPDFMPGRVAEASFLREAPAPEGAVVEEVVLARDPPIPGTFVRPAGPGRYPAVLYCHAHGGDYRLGRRELLTGSRFLQEPGYGVALASAGLASFCIDMTGFGDRQREGTESGSAKSLAWWGKSLFAVMLDDLSAALGYLAARPDVDARRIFTLGLSMGAAHAWWLAALDDRVAGTAHMCMLADILPLIGEGVHDRHGLYLTVPGLLTLAEAGDVAGLVAPRPQLVCHGGLDHLTPETARVPALDRVYSAYDRAGVPDRLATMLDPEAGHGESAGMRVAILNFLSWAAGRPVDLATV